MLVDGIGSGRGAAGGALSFVSTAAWCFEAAAAAQALYRETELSRETRVRLAEERKLLLQFEGGRESKPSKRDRRDIDRMRRRG